MLSQCSCELCARNDTRVDRPERYRDDGDCDGRQCDFAPEPVSARSAVVAARRIRCRFTARRCLLPHDSGCPAERRRQYRRWHRGRRRLHSFFCARADAPLAPLPPGAQQRPPARFYLTSKPAEDYFSESLIGLTVTNRRDNAEVGTVDELLIDQDGQIAALIVSIGGVMGVGEKDLAIAWDQIERKVDIEPLASENIN